MELRSRAELRMNPMEFIAFLGDFQASVYGQNMRNCSLSGDIRMLNILATI